MIVIRLIQLSTHAEGNNLNLLLRICAYPIVSPNAQPRSEKSLMEAPAARAIVKKRDRFLWQT